MNTNKIFYQRWPTITDSINLELSELKKHVADRFNGGAFYTLTTILPKDKKTFVQIIP